MKYLYYLYQLVVVLPLFLCSTILTALVTTVGCTLGDGHFWGYYPGKLWSQFTIRILLLPVKVASFLFLDPHLLPYSTNFLALEGLVHFSVIAVLVCFVLLSFSLL